MSEKKKKNHHGFNPTDKKHPAANGRRAFVKIGLIIGISVFALVGFGAFTSWRNSGPNLSATGGRVSAPPPVAQYAANAPMREYLYAGGKLLAVSEPAPPADLAVWRPSNGTWYVLNGQQQAFYYQWGVGTDVPAQGDYDGDGKTDFSIFRPSTSEWWVVKSSDGSFYAVALGASGDLIAQADYDGDGKTDIAVWRPSTGLWYIVQSSTGNMTYATYGINGDKPAPADYDGDGKADIAVWRNSNTTFYSTNSSDGASQTVAFTTSSTEPISGDYDGDGRANYAVKNGANWFIMNAARTSATPAIPWQSSGDIPVQNDYDGDGKVDIAVWRNSNGNWYIRQSSRIGQTDELRQVAWGLTGDIPVPSLYRR